MEAFAPATTDHRYPAVRLLLNGATLEEKHQKLIKMDKTNHSIFRIALFAVTENCEIFEVGFSSSFEGCAIAYRFGAQPRWYQLQL
jgi:hypothetical protein